MGLLLAIGFVVVMVLLFSAGLIAVLHLGTKGK